MYIDKRKLACKELIPYAHSPGGVLPVCRPYRVRLYGRTALALKQQSRVSRKKNDMYDFACSCRMPIPIFACRFVKVRSVYRDCPIVELVRDVAKERWEGLDETMSISSFLSHRFRSH